MKLYVFPGNIEPEILEISSHQVPYMRTAWFSSIVKESESIFLDLIGCKNGRAVFYTASGTGAMDSVVAGLISTNEKVMIIQGGSFGKRWKDICDYYKLESCVFPVEFAKDIDYDKLENFVAQEKPKFLFCQHHETSTGVLYDLKHIAKICKKYDTYLIVDVISSFLTDHLHMEEMGIDLCITSSQKGLNVPPGISLIAIGERLLDYPFRKSSYYFDFQENLRNLERGQTPYSPVTQLFIQLHQRLLKLKNIGAEKSIADASEKAAYFRTLCAANNWEMPCVRPSNCITGFFIHRNSEILIEELIKRDIYIMPGGIKNYYRVSHSGLQTKEDLNNLAEIIKEIESK